MEMRFGHPDRRALFFSNPSVFKALGKKQISESKFPDSKEAVFAKTCSTVATLECATNPRRKVR